MPSEIAAATPYLPDLPARCRGAARCGDHPARLRSLYEGDAGDAIPQVKHIPQILGWTDVVACGSLEVQSVEGPHGVRGQGQSAVGHSACSTSQVEMTDPRQEERLDALFRELDEDPPVPGRPRRVGIALLGLGLVLVAVGFLGAALARSPILSWSVVLGVNVLAVLCVAAGVLLLPERPAPDPPNRDVARVAAVRTTARMRDHLPFLRAPSRHARH